MSVITPSGWLYNFPREKDKENTSTGTRRSPIVLKFKALAFKV
jgi:hypothetical protein